MSEAIRDTRSVPGVAQPLFARLRQLVNSWKAYRYRVPYCVPYWNGKTYLAIVRCLLSGRIVRGAKTAELEKTLAAYLSIEHVRGYSQGRVALEAALTGLGIKSGDEVILPTFCCTSVMPSILATGAMPVLADVGPDLNLTVQSVEAVLTSRTRAILVPHLFGNPADIEAIESFAGSRRIKVIDDAAQAFGATFNGRLLGTFGDAGIMSFGSGKVCFGIGGGILVTRSGEVYEQIRSMALRDPDARRKLQQLFSTLLWRRWRQKLLPVLVILRRFQRKKPESPNLVPGPSPRESLSNLDSAVILSLIETLTQNIAARRERAQRYREILMKVPGTAVISHGRGSVCLTQVVKIEPDRDTERADMILERLRGAGYEVKGSYIPLHCFPEYSGFAPRLPRYADRVWPHLVELPCEPDVALPEVERIANLITSGLAA
jgi:dTDP-4-amino-4,6-dideoxygalactose transaminase